MRKGKLGPHSAGAGTEQDLNVGLSRQHLPFRHSPHRFFEDSRLSGSLRKCAKVFQRKNIPKKEILPQKGLRLQNI